MNFSIGADERAFAETVRGVLSGYRPVDWSPGAALDDRDASLSTALYALGIDEAVDAGHGFVAAAGLELGRACAPLAVFDELAVGAVALAASGVVRYAEARTVALDVREDGAFLVALDDVRSEPALDSQGFARLHDAGERAPVPELETWAAFHTAYLAGLAESTLALAVAHARTRVQFGRPLMALAPVQHLLADAAALAQGLELLAWEDASDPWPALVHAGEAACRVCEVSHQVHGAVGYALEAPLHSFFRRAHAVRVFTDAMARSARGAHA